MKIVRKEIVEGYELKLRIHPDGDKWMLTRKGHLVGLISTQPDDRYHLELVYSQDGYAIVEDFGGLEELWEKTKSYISEFNL